MRRSSLMLGTLIGVLLVTAGCTSTVTGLATPAMSNPASAYVDPLAPLPTPPTPNITWDDCTNLIKPQLSGQPNSDRDITYGCGRLDVPVDYAHPDAKTLSLFLVKAHLAGQSNRIGSLVVNPGGPGGSGADLAIGLSLSLPMGILQRFDVVGFDPRGVGNSAPLVCLDRAQKDAEAASPPRPNTPAEITNFTNHAHQFASDCLSKYPNLEHLNTVETARDLDLIRNALGDDKLSYLGYSYGTELGAVYATLFPNRVRAFVLDGAVDPTLNDVESDHQQAGGFENAYNRFLQHCIAQGSACPLDSDPAAEVTALLQQTAAAPIASPDPKETRKATDGIVTTAIISAMYDETSWDELSKAIASAKAGDPTGVFTLADSYNGRYTDSSGTVHFSNLLDANAAIDCNDSTQVVSLDQVESYSNAWAEQYPMFGGSFAWSLYTCTPWPTRRHPLPTITAPTAAPSLVIGTTNDPATPYAGAINLTKALGTARLLTWDGDGHTAYPKTSCVSNAVDDYLISLSLPPNGLVCPA
ncbi:alpha/beta hydrolase family protein [Antricoccus suffuscus]|uniref:Alpha/beta hydrolase family protein n=1 Tax=Antricoccus suffuscus TaxID=1629062 RepID=A0A2T1A528_9ACTN|nr:alpha/beta hydrolase [Antricoccus suffuscus]PRZ43696.1 alpha/beta hydrolase family protein [Antricoccus suffuscus]